MSRPLRGFVNGMGKALCRGICLLSLLVCVGVGWLWWRARGLAVPEQLEVAAAGADVEVAWEQAGLTVYAVGRWPGGAGVWRGGSGEHPLREDAAVLANGSAPLVAPPAVREWHLGEAVLRRGWIVIHVGAGGTPDRHPESWWEEELGSSRFYDPSHWSRPLPFFEADFLPFGVPVSLFALPPLLWLALRGRRLYVRRRRRRLGLCIRCGYDLTGNTSGTCSECGEAVVARGRVTA